jgi:tetratricopeptide (TPR) repeat protein
MRQELSRSSESEERNNGAWKIIRLCASLVISILCVVLVFFLIKDNQERNLAVLAVCEKQQEQLDGLRERLGGIEAGLAVESDRTKKSFKRVDIRFDDVLARYRDSASEKGQLDRIEKLVAESLSKSEEEHSEAVERVGTQYEDVTIQLQRLLVAVKKGMAADDGVVHWDDGEYDVPSSQDIAKADEAYRAKRYSEAAGMYRQVMSRQPYNAQVRLKYGLALYRNNPDDKKTYEEVEKSLIGAMSVRGDDVEALDVLAAMAVEMRALEKAEKYLERAIVLAPEGASRYYMAGFCAYGLQDYVGGEYYLGKDIELTKRARAYALRGDCRRMLGDAQEAEADWLAAVEGRDDTSKDSRPAVGVLYEKLVASAFSRKDLTSCRVYLARAKGEGYSDLLKAYEGVCLISEGNKDEGKKELEQLRGSGEKRVQDLVREGLALLGAAP